MSLVLGDLRNYFQKTSEKTPMGVFLKKPVTFSLYLVIIEYSSVWCVVVNNRSPMDLKLGGRP